MQAGSGCKEIDPNQPKSAIKELLPGQDVLERKPVRR